MEAMGAAAEIAALGILVLLLPCAAGLGSVLGGSCLTLRPLRFLFGLAALALCGGSGYALGSAAALATFGVTAGVVCVLIARKDGRAEEVHSLEGILFWAGVLSALGAALGSFVAHGWEGAGVGLALAAGLAGTAISVARPKKRSVPAAPLSSRRPSLPNPHPVPSAIPCGEQ